MTQRRYYPSRSCRLPACLGPEAGGRGEETRRLKKGTEPGLRKPRTADFARESLVNVVGGKERKSSISAAATILDGNLTFEKAETVIGCHSSVRWYPL